MKIVQIYPGFEPLRGRRHLTFKDVVPKKLEVGCCSRVCLKSIISMPRPLLSADRTASVKPIGDKGGISSIFRVDFIRFFADISEHAKARVLKIPHFP